jgi:RHS repeat-associated protein
MEQRELPSKNIREISKPVTPKVQAKSGPPAPASIDELARALKNDVDLIYQWVASNVDFFPIWGSHKGAFGTLIDRVAGSFDQASLMVALLRSGSTPYTANWVAGTIRLTAAQLQNLLGTDDSLDSQFWNPDSSAPFWRTPSSFFWHGPSARMLYLGQIPYEATYDSDGSLLYIDLSHVWVQVNISGTNYVFDPSFKTYAYTTGIDVGPTLGYDEAALISGAQSGATITTDYIQHLNETNIRNSFTSYGTNLLDWIRENAFAASTEEIIGGREIVPITAGPLRQTSLPYQTPGSTTLIWTRIPDPYRATIEIVYPAGGIDPIDVKFATDQLYGQRCIITYNAFGQPELLVNGDQYGVDTIDGLNPDQFYTVAFQIIHPFADSFANQTWTQSILGSGMYMVGTAVGTVSQAMVDWHRFLLVLYQTVGYADTDENVLGESLEILWFMHRTQANALEGIIDQLGDTTLFNYHTAGIVGYNDQQQCPYTDISGVTKSIASRVKDTSKENAAYAATEYVENGYEAGIMQQNFAVTGVATPRFMSVANSLGQKIFDVNASNWSAGSNIRSQLINWESFYLDQMDNQVANGDRLVVHIDGATSIDSYVGGGWNDIHGLGNGGLIKGQIMGGACGTAVSAANTNKGAAKGQPSCTTGDCGNGSAGCSCDPIELFSGNYLLFGDRDIAVGSGSFPYSLNFTRYYNSGESFTDGPLGFGWTHNLATNIESGSNGLRAVGEVSPKEAAAAIAFAYVLIQLDLADSPTLTELLIGSLSTLWLMDVTSNNAVTVNDGGQSRTFIKLVDGSYNPAPGYADSLITNLDGTFTVEAPQRLKWNFNSAGSLATYVDPKGMTVTYSYDTSNRVTGVINGLGRSLTLTYTGSQLTSVSDGNGRSVSFTVDSNDTLTQFTDANGKTTSYQYGSSLQLEKYFLPAFPDPTTPFVTNTYDSLGRIMSQAIQYPGLPTASVSNYYFAGSRSEVDDPLGNSHVMYYNSVGSLVRDINELGQVTDFVRDGLNRLISTTFPELNVLAFTYDNYNNVLTQTWQPKPGSSLADIVQTFTYDPTWNKISTFTDGESNTTTFSYDSTHGTLQTITRPTIGGSTPTLSFTYNSYGQVLTKTDETGIVDRFIYDSATPTEKLLSATRDYGTGRLNLLTSFGYDSVGNVTTITDPNGNSTSFEYDNERRLLQQTSPSPFNYVTTWDYNDNGWRTSLSRQTGDVSNPYQTWTWQFFTHGEVVSIADPANNSLTLEYDSLGRVSARIDAEGREYQFAYDYLSRIETVTDPLSVIADSRTYTANGMLSTREDASSNVTTYQYDGLDRLEKRIYPDSTFDQFSYDANNNVLNLLTRDSETITNTYDVLTRLSTSTPGSLATQTISYDLAGRQLSIATPVSGSDPASGSYGFGYDTAGRLTSQSTPSGLTIGYQLDNNSNRTRLIWPDSYYADYLYDQLNRLTDIKLNGATTSAVQIQYDELSRRTQLTYENGCVTTYAYQINNDMSSLEHAFIGSSVTFEFAYNLVHQITSLTADDTSFIWKPSSSSSTVYSTANNLNQYPLVDSTAYSYNDNGCLTGGLLNSASFDVLNRMTEAVNGSITNQYWYDPFNRQAKKSVSGTDTNYLYDGSQRIADYNDSLTLQNRYIRGDRLDETFLYVSGSDTTYLHADRIGSVIAESDSVGANTNKYLFSPFGESVSVSASGYGFTSQRYDAEIGLYNYKARFYSPSIGRFLQPDPIGFAAGDLNLYSYVGNDPLNLTDPSGNQESTQEGFWSNFNFLTGYMLGTDPSNYHFYGPDTLETQSLSQSVGAEQIRSQFYQSPNDHVDNGTFSSEDAGKYYELNPANWGATGLQVGGFAGATVVQDGDQLTFTIYNTAGLNSFAGGFRWINKDFPSNMPDSYWGPFHTIYQVFKWSEKIDPKRMKNKPPGPSTPRKCVSCGSPTVPSTSDTLIVPLYSPY